MQPKNEDELNAAEALTGMQNNIVAPHLLDTVAREPSTRHMIIHNNSGLDVASSATSKESLSKPNFPMKLFNVLESNEYSDIICWLPGGKAFIIKDKKKFAREILPCHFKQSLFTSFTRKLTRWKFLRVPRGPYIGAYYHSLFRKDARALCSLIKCNGEKFNPVLLAKAKELLNQSRAAQTSVDAQRSEYLKRMEEMKRIAIMKDQLMRIRIRRAQLFEEQKRFLLNSQYGLSGFPSHFPTTNHVSQSDPVMGSKNDNKQIRDQSSLLKPTTFSQFLLPTSYHPLHMTQISVPIPPFNNIYSTKEEADRAEEWIKKNICSANSA